MPVSETSIKELDHPAGRLELSRLATAAAREELGRSDVEILWDGMWIRRAGPLFFPDPEIWRDQSWDKWLDRAAKYRRDVDDYWYHVYRPREGDAIVDIGAGRGEDVFRFSSSVGASGKVWAFEPHPVSFRALQTLCDRNGLLNVTAVNVACTEKREKLQIETLPVWESNYIRCGEPSGSSAAVDGIPFDELCAELGIERIDFLKMNIEGAERMALPGAREALRRAKFVCIAAHDFRAARGEGEAFRTLEFVREFLQERGFQVVTRDQDPRYYVPFHVHGFRG